MTVGRDATAIEIGAGTLYIAPIGTVEPTSLTGVLDVGFIDIGYTESGSTFTDSRTVSPVNVDEEFYDLSNIVTNKKAEFSFALAQLTAKNLQVAYAGGTITTGGTDVRFDPPAPGTEVRVMIVWQSPAADIRILGRKCFQTGSVATMLKKGTPQATLPVTFELEKPTGVQPYAWWLSLARKGS